MGSWAHGLMGVRNMGNAGSNRRTSPAGRSLREYRQAPDCRHSDVHSKDPGPIPASPRGMNHEMASAHPTATALASTQPVNIVPDPTVLASDLGKSFQRSAEEIVPWFVAQMPRMYFEDTSATEVANHLRASASSVRMLSRQVPMTAMSERWIEFMQSFAQPLNLNLNL